VSCYLPSSGSGHLAVSLVLPSAIDDAAASSGSNQLTSAAKTAVPVVGTFATWKAC